MLKERDGVVRRVMNLSSEVIKRRRVCLQEMVMLVSGKDWI